MLSIPNRFRSVMGYWLSKVLNNPRPSLIGLASKVPAYVTITVRCTQFRLLFNAHFQDMSHQNIMLPLTEESVSTTEKKKN